MSRIAHNRIVLPAHAHRKDARTDARTDSARARARAHPDTLTRARTHTHDTHGEHLEGARVTHGGTGDGDDGDYNGD